MARFSSSSVFVSGSALPGGANCPIKTKRFVFIGNFNVPDMRSKEEIEAERKAAEKLEKKRKYNREIMRRLTAEKRAAETAALREAANQ